MPLYTGSLDSEEFVDALATHDVGTALVMSTDMDRNVVGVDRLVECLGAPNVYYLPPGGVPDRVWLSGSHASSRPPQHIPPAG